MLVYFDPHVSSTFPKTWARIAILGLSAVDEVSNLLSKILSFIPGLKFSDKLIRLLLKHQCIQSISVSSNTGGPHCSNDFHWLEADFSLPGRNATLPRQFLLEIPPVQKRLICSDEKLLPMTPPMLDTLVGGTSAKPKEKRLLVLLDRHDNVALIVWDRDTLSPSHSRVLVALLVVVGLAILLAGILIVCGVGVTMIDCALEKRTAEGGADVSPFRLCSRVLAYLGLRGGN